MTFRREYRSTSTRPSRSSPRRPAGRAFRVRLRLPGGLLAIALAVVLIGLAGSVYGGQGDRGTSPGRSRRSGPSARPVTIAAGLATVATGDSPPPPSYGRFRHRAYGVTRFNAVHSPARRLNPAYLPQTKKQQHYISLLPVVPQKGPLRRAFLFGLTEALLRQPGGIERLGSPQKRPTSHDLAQPHPDRDVGGPFDRDPTSFSDPSCLRSRPTRPRRQWSSSWASSGSRVRRCSGRWQAIGECRHARDTRRGRPGCRPARRAPPLGATWRSMLRHRLC